jgi:hypothetical protein
MALGDLASVLIAAGRYGESRDVSGRAVALLTPMAGGSPPDITNERLLAMSQLNHAVALRKDGNLAAASATLDPLIVRCKAMIEAHKDRDARYLIGEVLDERACVLAANPRFRIQALSLFGAAEKWLGRLTIEFPSVLEYKRVLAAILDHRAGVHLALGKPKPAATDCNRAIDLMTPLVAARRPLGSDLAQLGRTEALAAKIAIAEHSEPKARDRLRDAVKHLQASFASEIDHTESRSVLDDCRAELKRLGESSTAPAK